MAYRPAIVYEDLQKLVIYASFDQLTKKASYTIPPITGPTNVPNE